MPCPAASSHHPGSNDTDRIEQYGLKAVATASSQPQQSAATEEKAEATVVAEKARFMVS